MRFFPLLCASTALVTPVVMPVSAYAQQITSQIEGEVTDSAGAPIAGAAVVITDVRTGVTRTLETDNGGRFVARSLTVGGPYSVTASAAGYQGQTVEDITISLQGATALSFNLESSGTAADETIVITGQRANIQLRAIGPGTSFGQEVLQNAPTFNRDIRDIIRVDPRVSLDRDDGGSGVDRISCLGGNDRGNAFTVDGVFQGDVYGLNETGFSSRSSTPLPYDAVRETQVQFAPFDVEYGNFTGCAVNVVTRSGSNRVQAGAFFEYSGDGMRGKNVADRSVAPVEAEKRWGAYLGGPIIPDRLWFFGAYEHHEAGQSQDDGPAGAGYPNELAGVPVAEFNRISEILSRVYGIDTGPLVTSRPFDNDRYFGRVDWQINDDHRLEVTYQRLEEGTVRADDFFNSQGSPQVTGLNTFLVSGTFSDYYSARLYSQITDSISTELRYSRSKITDRQDPVGGGEAQSANPIPRIIVGIDNPGDVPSGTVLAGPGNSRSANDLRTSLEQYRALLNLDAGNHQFKAGFELNRADLFNLFVQNATGTLVFRNAEDLEAGLLSPGTGNNQTSTFPNTVVSGQTEGAFGNFSRTGDVTDAAAEFRRDTYSFYLQDDWRLNDQLNVVLGVRTDFYDGDNPDINPLFLQRYGFPNTTGFNDLDPVIMPRLGFTYDFDDFSVFSRAQLRGGVGRFAGGDPLVWFGNAFQNNGFGFAEGTSQSSGCPSGQIDVVVGGSFTGVPSCIQANGISRAARGEGDTQSIDPDIQMPTVLRANIGFQSELDFAPTGFFSGWRLNLDYIYSKYQNPFTIVDLSQTINPALGLSGSTIDGRPIYRAIDPNVAGCNAELVDINPVPVYTGVTSVCFNTSRDDELMLTNSDGYRSHIASFILSKDFDGGFLTPGGGLFFSLGYAYTDAQDRRNLYNSTAGSNYDLSAAFDRQNPDASRGFYESRHNLTLQGRWREQFFGELDSTFSFTYVARSGRPYSLTFGGGGVFNDSASGNNNALAYIPTGITDPNISPLSNMTAVQQLADYAASLGCARDFAGRTIDRNSCTNDWYHDLDLSFSQELPGPGRFFGRDDRIRVFAMVDNFLNLLDSDWNVHRRRNFSGLQDVASLGSTGPGNTGVDAQGRYIISGFNGLESIENDNQINVSSSVWRLKVGISYDF